MSADQSEDPALYPPDLSTSDEDRALFEDLKAYDNPQAFSDPTLPLQFQFRIVIPVLAELPEVVRVELNGEHLSLALREAFFAMFGANPTSRAGLLREYETDDWNEVRSKVLADDEYWKREQEMWWFFVRHFPKLALSVYEIAIQISLLAALRNEFEEPGRQVLEKSTRQIISGMVKALENDIKRLLKTRSSGRPKKPSDAFPETVRKVIDTAWEMMGNARGKDAVPALKTIADRLNLSESALGKRLKREGFAWTVVKGNLAHQT